MLTYDRLEPAYLGDTGPDVAYTRRVLKCWPEDAPYDLTLASAVRGYQAAVGLPVTGWLDEETWKALP